MSDDRKSIFESAAQSLIVGAATLVVAVWFTESVKWGFKLIWKMITSPMVWAVIVGIWGFMFAYYAYHNPADAANGITSFGRDMYLISSKLLDLFFATSVWYYVKHIFIILVSGLVGGLVILLGLGFYFDITEDPEIKAAKIAAKELAAKVAFDMAQAEKEFNAIKNISNSSIRATAMRGRCNPFFREVVSTYKDYETYFGDIEWLGKKFDSLSNDTKDKILRAALKCAPSPAELAYLQTRAVECLTGYKFFCELNEE